MTTIDKPYTHKLSNHIEEVTNISEKGALVETMRKYYAS